MFAKGALYTDSKQNVWLIFKNKCNVFFLISEGGHEHPKYNNIFYLFVFNASRLTNSTGLEL